MERSHRIDHDEFWSRNHFASFDEAEQALDGWAHHYNTERFSLALSGHTPAEALAAKPHTLRTAEISQTQ